MVFGFNNNHNKTKSVFWGNKVFTHLKPKAIPSDAKTYYTRRTAQAGTFKNRDGLDRLFESLSHTDHRIESGSKSSVQNRPVPQNLIQSNLKNDPLLSQLIHDKKHLKNWPSVITELIVSDVIDETKNVKTICLVGRQPFLFNYTPGQFITLNTSIKGHTVQRSYSIASSPSRPHSIEITVKRIPGGLVSNWLCDHIKVGDRLKVTGPFGRFSCFNFPARKLLFLAAGSGIVPIMSMLRWIVDSHAKVDVKLILSFRKPTDIIFRKELEFIIARHKNIDLLLTFTGSQRKDHKWRGPTGHGRIDANILSKTVTDLLERQVFLCGPEPFMQSTAKILKRQGAAKMNIHKESFIYKSLSVETPIPSKTIRNNKGKYRVQFAKSGLTVRSDKKTNLLDLAEAHNIRIDNDCLNGNCGECMVRCLWGKVDMLAEAEIDPQDKQSGWIYSCCAYPMSDVVLDV